jgi:HAD superfamily hydrolase (TIGR01509 family)
MAIQRAVAYNGQMPCTNVAALSTHIMQSKASHLMKAVIWDLDNTIVDTEDLHRRAWQTITRQHGIEYSDEEFRASYGRNNTEILRELLPDPTPDMMAMISVQKEVAFRTLVQPGAVDLLPGVADWLDAIRRQGLWQVVGSSGPMANIVTTIGALGIADYFLGMLSGATLPQGKPHPDLFLRCAAAARVPPQECLVIEDSIYGVEAAHRAGMFCIAVGPLAHSERLQPFLAAARGPRCVAVASLAALDPVYFIQQWPSG